MCSVLTCGLLFLPYYRMLYCLYISCNLSLSLFLSVFIRRSAERKRKQPYTAREKNKQTYRQKICNYRGKAWTVECDHGFADRSCLTGSLSRKFAVEFGNSTVCRPSSNSRLDSTILNPRACVHGWVWCRTWLCLPVSDRRIGYS